jgi:hypothetical protein
MFKSLNTKQSFSCDFCVWYKIRFNFILLHMKIGLFQHHLLKRLSFNHCVLLTSLVNISWLYIHGFISGLFTLLHRFTCLFLCQYHTVLIIAALCHILKLENGRPPALFFPKTYLALIFRTIFVYFSKKVPLEF